MDFGERLLGIVGLAEQVCADAHIDQLRSIDMLLFEAVPEEGVTGFQMLLQPLQSKSNEISIRGIARIAVSVAARGMSFCQLHHESILLFFLVYSPYLCRCDVLFMGGKRDCETDFVDP